MPNQRCTRITAQGTQCKRQRVDGLTVCRQHAGAKQNRPEGPRLVSTAKPHRPRPEKPQVVVGSTGGTQKLMLAELTGNPADDAYAISAGTGGKISPGSGGSGGSVTKTSIIATGVLATDLGGAAASDLTAETSARQSADALLAPKASPTFTGTVTVPTPTAGDNTTKAASTAFVTMAVDAAQSAAEDASIPLTDKGAANGVATLDSTGNVPASQLGNAPAGGSGTGTVQSIGASDNTITIDQSDLANPKIAVTSGAFATPDDLNTAVAAETDRAEGVEASLAPKDSPTLTGTPIAPTPDASVNTSQIATMAAVHGVVTAAASSYDAAGAADTAQANAESTAADALAVALPINVANLSCKIKQNSDGTWPLRSTATSSSSVTVEWIGSDGGTAPPAQGGGYALAGDEYEAFPSGS